VDKNNLKLDQIDLTHNALIVKKNDNLVKRPRMNSISLNRTIYQLAELAMIKPVLPKIGI
jgi:hypothetical protein